MERKIDEPVSVNLIFDCHKRKSTISKVVWKNRVYKIKKQGLHHTYKDGDKIFHVFTVSENTLNFRLILDTQSLVWKLTEIYDPNLV